MKFLRLLTILFTMLSYPAAADLVFGKSGAWEIRAWEDNDGNHSHCVAQRMTGRETLLIVYPTEQGQTVDGAINIGYGERKLAQEIEPGATYQVDIFIDDRFIVSAEAGAITDNGFNLLVMRFLDSELEKQLVRGNVITIDVGRQFKVSLAGSSAAMSEARRCNDVLLAKEKSSHNSRNSVASRRLSPSPASEPSRNSRTGPLDEFDEIAVKLSEYAGSDDTVFKTVDEIRAEDYEDNVLSVWENSDSSGFLLETEFAEDRVRQAYFDKALESCLGEYQSTPFPGIEDTRESGDNSMVSQYLMCLDPNSEEHLIYHTVSVFDSEGNFGMTLMEIINVPGPPDVVKAAWLENSGAY